MTFIIGGTEGRKKCKEGHHSYRYIICLSFFQAFFATAYIYVAFLTAKYSDLILVVSILVIKKEAKKTLTLT